MDRLERNGRPWRAILVWAGCLVFAAPVAAQQTMFRNYTVKDGLSQSQIETVIQDSMGYLWAGTYHGLSRFDGHKFTNFTVKDGLADNIVTAAHLDATGRLWFGHPSGNITTYAAGAFHVLPATEARQGSTIQDFLEDGNGTLWIATEGAGLLAVRGGGETQPAPVPSSPRRAHALAAWGGRLWLGADDGLYSFESIAGDATPRFDALALPSVFAHDVQALAADAEGKLWIGTADAGLWVLSDSSTAPFRVKGLPEVPVLELELDAEGSLWVSAEGQGVWKIPIILDEQRVSDLRTFTVENGLNYNTVRAIRVDREGNVWFGTNGGGLSVYLGGLFEWSAHSENPEVLAVWSMVIDDDGIMWMGTDGASFATLARAPNAGKSASCLPLLRACRTTRFERCISMTTGPCGWPPRAGGCPRSIAPAGRSDGSASCRPTSCFRWSGVATARFGWAPTGGES